MRLKLVNKIYKQDVILVGKVENENSTVEKINRILAELNHPILKEFPYKDCRKLVERIKFRKTIKFLNENLAEIGLSNFKLNTDTKNPRKLFLTVDKMPNKYFDIYSIDNTVISLAFSQLFLTGNIEPEIKKLAKIAIEREILFADVWEENSKTRIEKLNKLTKSLNLAE